MANCESTNFLIIRRDSDQFIEGKDEWEFDIGDFVEWLAVHTKVEFSGGGVKRGGALGNHIGDGSGGSGLFVQHIKLVYLWGQCKEIKYAQMQGCSEKVVQRTKGRTGQNHTLDGNR